MGFPSKNDHFGVFLGVPPFKETPIYCKCGIKRWVLLLVAAHITQLILSQTWWAGAVHRLAESLRRTEPPEFCREVGKNFIRLLPRYNGSGNKHKHHDCETMAPWKHPLKALMMFFLCDECADSVFSNKGTSAVNQLANGKVRGIDIPMVMVFDDLIVFWLYAQATSNPQLVNKTPVWK